MIDAATSAAPRTYVLAWAPAIADQRRAGLLTTLVLAGVAVGIILWQDQSRLSYPRAAAVVGITGVALAAGSVIAYRRQAQAIRSYRLALWEDRLELTRDGFPTLSIRRDDVTQIRETAGRHVVIRTADRLGMLGIPSYLQGYDDLLRRLADWKAIDRVTGTTPWLLLHLLVMALMGAGMIACFYSTDPRIVLPVGTAILATLAYAAYTVPRNPHLDHRTRKAMWVTAFPALSVIIRMVMVSSS